MLSIFPWTSGNNSIKRGKCTFGFFILSLILSSCANITVQPKDPELIRLGNFTDEVTRHLFEMHPETYEKYQATLEKDIDPKVFAQLKYRGIARTKDNIKKTIQNMEKTHSRCLISIESTTFPSKATPEGLIPIEIKGTCVRTVNDVSKASQFDFLYLVGTNIKTKQPIIASIQIKKFD